MITIPSNTTIIGEFRSSGRICFQGHFDGLADIDGTLIITESAVWSGRIFADKVIIEGNIEGDVIAREDIKIGPRAVVDGTVTSPKISIEQGGRINGEMIMAKPDPVGLLGWEKPGVADKPEVEDSPEPMVKAG